MESLVIMKNLVYFFACFLNAFESFQHQREGTTFECRSAENEKGITGFPPCGLSYGLVLK